MRATFVFAVTSSPAVDFVFSRFLAAVASARDFSYVSGHLATHQRRAPTPGGSVYDASGTGA